MIEKAYIAGFIDGDGSIYMSQNTHHATEICLYQKKGIATFFPEIQKIYKGTIGTIHVKSKIGNAEIEVLKIRKKIEVLKILADILPHLIIKKDKAHQILEWLKEQRDEKEAYACSFEKLCIICGSPIVFEHWGKYADNIKTCNRKCSLKLNWRNRKNKNVSKTNL